MTVLQDLLMDNYNLILYFSEPRIRSWNSKRNFQNTHICVWLCNLKVFSKISTIIVRIELDGICSCCISSWDANVRAFYILIYFLPSLSFVIYPSLFPYKEFFEYISGISDFPGEVPCAFRFYNFFVVSLFYYKQLENYIKFLSHYKNSWWVCAMFFFKGSHWRCQNVLFLCWKVNQMLLQISLKSDETSCSR